MILPGFPMPLAMGAGGGGPQFVAASASGTGGTSVTVACPSGTQNGDLMVMMVYATSQSAATSQTGWTKHGESLFTAALSIFSRVASSEPASYTISRQNTVSAAIATYRGGEGAVDAVGAITTFANPFKAASITPPNEGVLLACFGAHNFSTPGPSVSVPPSGMTQRAFWNANEPSVAIYDLSPSPAGATGDKLLSWNVSPTGASILLQIR